MKDFENLAAYLPATILKQLVNDSFQMPQEHVFKTIVLFADVSGFTVLSEKLCAEGQGGIEELANQLNKYMAQVVKLTSRAGGDVFKFAGDAMISVWPIEESGSIEEASIRAINCCLDMQLRLAGFKFQFRKTDADGHEVAHSKLIEGELGIKLGIGLGDAKILYLGGESDNVMPERYEYVAMGPALEQAFNAEGAAVRGQVVISQAVYDSIRETKLAFDLIAPAVAPGFYHVQSLSTKLTWRSREVANFAPSNEVEERIWRCVPAAVLPYLNESNEFWAPELRRVTTLFVNLGFSEEDMAVADMEILHKVYRAMQRCVFHFEGTINKFLCDDKGSTLLVVFGLPPFAHENDATRGVLSAMSILTELDALGKKGFVGITTGEAFCGVVGTRGNRREYSVIGDVVNVSARLMSESKHQHCGYLMDRATMKAIEVDGLKSIYFTSVLLKGKSVELPVYQVSGSVVDLEETLAPTAAVANTPQKKSVKTKKATRASITNLKQDEASEAQKLAAAIPSNVKLQVSAITEAPKLRFTRDVAIQRSLDEREKAGALEKALSSFARASEIGLKMGSGKSKTREELLSGRGDPSPPAVLINSSRPLKAAQITFANCSTKEKGESLSTTFTLALDKSMETLEDVKHAALTRLGTRKLLIRGPDVDRNYFSFKWNEPGRENLDILDEQALLADFKDVSFPMIKLVLVEHTSKRRFVAKPPNTPKPVNANDPPKVISNQRILEEARTRLLNRESGCIVVIEGMQGVGKTFLAEQVFLKGEVISSALTAVAMGNPYETNLLSSTLNVWTVLLKQLLEETLAFRKIASHDASFPVGTSVNTILDGLNCDDEDEICQFAKEAVLCVDPSFTQFDMLNEVCKSILETGHLPVSRASVVMSDSTLNGSTKMLAHLIVGLSIIFMPVVLVIDDSHSMDLSSWQMVEYMATLIMEHKALVIVALLHRQIILAESFSTGVSVVEGGLEGYNNMRALENKHTQNRRAITRVYDEILKKPCLVVIKKVGDVENTSEILKEKLGVDQIEGLSPLVTFLKSKAEGNRLFISNCVDDLLEEHLLLSTNGKYHLSEAFHERLKYHELPIPSSVEGICSTLLDSMSVTQQMALKVAAIIGERFTLELITSMFPIIHLKNTLPNEWKTLVQLGVVVESVGKSEVNQWYHFSNPWMLETLRKRMLFKQRRKLHELFKTVSVEKEKELNMKFMESSGMNKLNKEIAIQSGVLFVRKEKSINIMKLWKKRFVVLQQDELVQYYEGDVEKKRLEVIKLNSPGTTVSNKIGGYFPPVTISRVELSSGSSAEAKPFCFVVHATRWFKKGAEQNTPRDFYMAPESLKDQMDWVFKIGFQIDYCRMVEDNKINSNSNNLSHSDPEHRTAVAGVNMDVTIQHKDSVASSASDHTAASHPHHHPRAARPSFIGNMMMGSKKASPPMVTATVSSPIMRHRGPSTVVNNTAPLSAEYADPGAHIVSMTAAHFNSISAEVVVNAFWEGESEETMVQVRGGLNPSFFFELGDMALVSLNGQGSLDGYLLGYTSTRKLGNDKWEETAVIHQCAVLPMVRRRKIATKLYARFLEDAKNRKCGNARALVPKDSIEAHPFHSSLGFSMNMDDSLDVMHMTMYTMSLWRPLEVAEPSRSQEEEDDDDDDDDE